MTDTKKPPEEYVSNCCGAGNGEYDPSESGVGKCSKCGEGCAFERIAPSDDDAPEDIKRELLGEFIVKCEDWTHQSSSTPVAMKQAYTKSGAYIGSIDDALRLIRNGIEPQLRTTTSTVCSIGFCEKEQKWYGWSHRAIYGFGLASIVNKGDVLHGKYSLGWQPSNLDEARQMACDFAEEVS